MKIVIRHKILKDLRENRAIPLEAMPDKLGMSLDEYKKYESGDIKVNLKLAEKIAGIFKRNWSVFLLDGLTEEPLIKRDNRTVENQKSSLHEKTIEAIEDANYIVEFVGGLGLNKGLKIKYEDIKSLDAESLANRVRQESKITIHEQEDFKNVNGAFKRWKDYIESLGIFISQYPLNKEDKIRAFSVTNNNQAVIVLNTNDTVAGRIFSLFHEFCHILRRSSGVCDLHYSSSSDLEVFCNKFASSFLAPTQIVADYINSKGKKVIVSDLEYHSRILSTKLRVSQLVIYRKFAALDLISDQQYSKIHKEFLNTFSSIARKKEGQGGGPDYYVVKIARNGKAYSNIVLDALNKGSISAFEAGNALGVGVKNLNEYMNKTA